MKEVTADTITDRFEQQYLRLRTKEGRVYTDEQVEQFPYIGKTHTHYKEWKTRAASFNKLSAYIKRMPVALNILEVGCGNGWLSAQIATLIKGEVTGTDINHTELEQAKRVFQKKSNLHFINGDIRDGVLINKKFNIIIFAASIQYFSSLHEILDLTSRHLTTGGEVHFLDSHFYRRHEIHAARLRTKDYYLSMGFPELSNYYYHHSIEDLKPHKFIIMHDPGSWKNKLRGTKNPFHWIVIKKDNINRK